MPFILSVLTTLLLMAHSGDLNKSSNRIKVAAIIEQNTQHVRALEVIQFLCQHKNASRMDLVFETHNLSSDHSAFMDGRVGPLLGENVEFILWVVTCETLDFLPNKLRLVSSPSLFLTVDRCRTPEPTENIGLFYIAIADLIERLQWPDINIIYDNSIGGSELVSLLNELSARFVKSSPFAIDSTSDDYKRNILKKFISLNQKRLSNRQFLVILKKETLAEVLHSASILMMTFGKMYWILVNDDLQPEDLVGFGVNPRNANMLLFRKVCDRDRKDLRKVNELSGDLQKMLPKDHKYILTLTCMVIKSLINRWKPDLKSLAECRKRPLDSMSSTSGMLMSTQSQPPNSCYPAFEVATVQEGGYDDSIATTVARWRPDTKLVVKDEFFPNQKYGLGNAKIIVSTLPLVPYAMRLSPIKNSGFTGFTVRILDELSLRMNFSYEWREPEDEQFGMLINGSFTGLVGQLERREIDLVVGALTVSYRRSKVVDYTYPYTEEGRGMLIKKPSDSIYDLFKVFRAFKPTTWLSFGVVVVIVAVALAIIDGFKRMSDANNTIRGLPDNRTAKRICLFSHLSWKEALWSIYTMHLFQGGAQEPTSSRSRVIIMCWWLFTILISTYYTANLTAHFTFNDVPTTIESLKDLAKDESVVPVTLQGSAMYEELRVRKTNNCTRGQRSQDYSHIGGERINRHVTSVLLRPVDNAEDDQYILVEQLSFFLSQGGAQEPTSSRSRVIIMCWWLFTILISTYYTANLTAHFTVNDVPSTIESLEDLANDESLVPITLAGSAIYDELNASTDPIKQKVFSRMKFAPNVKSSDESLDMVRSGKYVFISLWSEVKTLAAQHCEDMMVAGKPYGIKRIGFALPRGSALTAEVSKMLGIMREAGMIDKWRRVWWKEKAACRESDDQKPQQLNMKSLGGVYIVFAVFTLVAFVILGLEIMNHKQNKRKRISLDDDVTRY